MMNFFGPRSAIRWLAGGLLGLTAVVQSMRALVGLHDGASSLGAVAILALAALTTLGFVELLRARVRIGRELIAMNARPAGGSLVEARRARLSEIAAVGGRPDASALAERAATEERGRAYLGRYLVAVAVLIGLVGTFSGLAQALHALPTILAGADAQQLPHLLSAPLAGLDLVFAAGVVGILSTLALALVQGDLQLHEEQALARLDDETTHELIPTLWPSAQSNEERMLRELALLRSEASTLGAALSESGAQLAERVTAASAEAARGLLAASERASQLLADRLVTTLERQSQRIATELGRGADTQAVLADELRTHATAHRAQAEESVVQMAAQLGALHREIGSQAEATQHVLVHEAERHGREATAAWQTLRADLVTAIVDERVALVESMAAMRGALTDSMGAASAALVEASEATRKTLVGSVESAGASVEIAARGAVVALRESSQASIASLENASRAIVASADAGLAASRESLAEATRVAGGALGVAVHDSVEHMSGFLASRRADLETTLLESRAAVDLFIEGAVAKMASSAEDLARAATSLAETHQGLAPQLEALTPELRGLTHEVALLGARATEEGEQPLFADELLRLGEGMARLEALVRMAQGHGKGARS